MSSALARWTENLDESASEKATLLHAFCERFGTTPDDLVQRCLRTTKDGDVAIRSKGRAEVAAEIDAFAHSDGREGHAATVAGNVIRSFLIYNGVFLPGRASVD